MEIQGKIHQLDGTEQITETFCTRTLILDCSTYEQGTGRRFDNYVKLQAINRNVDLLNDYQEGERVKVSFYPNGRFYEKDGEQRHSQNLNLFKIQKL